MITESVTQYFRVCSNEDLSEIARLAVSEMDTRIRNGTMKGDLKCHLDVTFCSRHDCPERLSSRQPPSIGWGSGG